LKRFLPTSRGFDDFYGFVNTGIDYFTHERYGVPSMYRNERPTSEDRGTYCTYLFQREAVRFLKRHHDRPFFLYVPFNAPHSASNLDPKIRSAPQAPEKYKALYPHLAEKAGFVRGVRYGKPALIANKAKRRLEYAASVTCMDDAIGELLDLLDRYGIAEDTVVIFFSDNGGGVGSDNSPLKGRKGWFFEGGIRVPCIIRYPRRIPAGTVCSAFVSAFDLLPTILAEAGVRPAKGIALDGFNVMPTLARGAPSPRREMFWQRRDEKAARVGVWKWVESHRGSGLFDLSKDIGEKNDLSSAFPEKLRELKEAFSRWRARMDAAEPRGPFRNW